MTRTEMALLRFFSMLFPCREGFIELRAIPTGQGERIRRDWIPCREKHQAVSAALIHAQSHNVYFGVCTRQRCGKGSKAHIGHVTALWADLDEAKLPGGINEAFTRLGGLPWQPSAIIHSGHGLHVYYFLDEPIPISGTVAVVEAALRALQAELGSDPVHDVTRILRVPGTRNLKEPGNPVPVRIVQLEDRRVDFSDVLDAVNWERELMTDYETAEGGALTEEGKLGLGTVLACDFLQYCKTNAETLSEPLWYAMITNLLPFRGGREAIHELSSPHPNYSFEETEAKIEHALRDAPGPHTARYLLSHGFVSEDCQGAGVNSPAALARSGFPPCREVLPRRGIAAKQRDCFQR